MFTIASSKLPRRDFRPAVLASAVVHFCAFYALVMSSGDDPAPSVRQESVTFFEVAPSPSGPPSPVPSRSSPGPAPAAIQLPDLKIDTRYLPSVEHVSSSISLQQLDLSTLSAFASDLPARGPTTTLPLLLNQAQAEQELRQRAESLQSSDTVHLHLLIDVEGQVRETRVGQSSGSAIFDQLAIEVISSTGKFLPAHRSGVPIEVWVGFPVSVEKVDPLQ